MFCLSFLLLKSRRNFHDQIELNDRQRREQTLVLEPFDHRPGPHRVTMRITMT